MTFKTFKQGVFAIIFWKREKGTSGKTVRRGDGGPALESWPCHLKSCD